jgi:hypothetical protein
MVMMFAVFYILSILPDPNKLFIVAMFPFFSLIAIIPFAFTYLRMRKFKSRIILKPSF